MNYVLLVGAGFTRNWGGWLSTEVFEYLLGCPEIKNSRSMQPLFWRWLGRGGFEYALAELQDAVKSDPTIENKRLLTDVNDAVSRMLADMNETLLNQRLEFNCTDSDSWIGAFLSRFNAIFSLNQDLFLEYHFLPITFTLPYYGNWAGHDLPGMEMLSGQQPPDWQSWGRRIWKPTTNETFSVLANHQPLFKLHGSSNWTDATGNNLLVMGGDKVSLIQRSPLLAWYLQQFEEMLERQDTRLMIIGYGFLDLHINAVIQKAVDQHGLEIFNISPAGAEHAHRVTHMSDSIILGPQLENAFQRGLIGASRRPLSQIFGPDQTERKKVLRFFDQ